MASEVGVLGGGVAVGMLFGLFGVGGSSFATPVLALLGVPPFYAVASALPAALPSAASGAVGYLRRGEVNWRVVGLSVAGGLPMTVLGALASPHVGGHSLLVASGVVLVIVGLRVLRPISPATLRHGFRRLSNPWFVVGGAASVGLFTGLLANGGGFLLVPLYLLVLGLPMRTSSGTSLAVIAALSIPTLVTHWALGHVNWPVAAAFAAGSIPAAYLGGMLAQHFKNDRLRVAFGCIVVTFAVYFLFTQITRR
ncbi:MAG TPA: sulfite exporter TauE/SafE family protein [Actinomycetota bacterium]|nr:sulfite exporter TauE/SafE family protein [Actinomycetota bacterium]